MGAEHLRDLERALVTHQDRRTHALADLAAERAGLEMARQQAQECQQAALLVQAALDGQREALRDRLEGLVTRGLRAVFGRPDLEFVLQPVEGGRGALGLEPVIRSSHAGHDLVAGVTDGHGGGMADVCAFVLRVVFLMLQRPALAPVLVLDEPFRHVSASLRAPCASLVRFLMAELGLQFVIVTHDETLAEAADCLYRVRLDNQHRTAVERLETERAGNPAMAGGGKAG